MKKNKIIYWVATAIIVFWDAVIPAFTSHTPLAVEGVRHLGYPDYFRVMLTVFKVIGGILLIFPFVPSRYKEWAYTGFGISMICASVSYLVLDGFSFFAIFPLLVMCILIVSYVYFHKLQRARAN